MLKFALPHGLLKKILIVLGLFLCAFICLILLVIFFGDSISREGVPKATPVPAVDDTKTSDDLQPLASDVTGVVQDPDTIRIGHIDLISKKMADALARNIAVPKPENPLELFFGTQRVGFQGRAGQAFFSAIGLVFPRDPETDDMYHFFYDPDTRSYEFLAFVTDPKKSNALLGGKPVYRAGQSLDNFILMKDGLILSTVLPDGEKIDLGSSIQRKLKNLEPFHSCHEIKHTFQNAWSGKYIIDMRGQDLQVYCDMQTDEGGWTLFYANNGHPESPIKMSYVQMRDVLATNPVNNLSEYNTATLAGLLDYTVFTDQGAREVLIRNRAGEVNKWVKFTFSTSRALSWALGENVLGKTSTGCLKVPLRATWSIENSDGTLKHQKLGYLMNHGGTNWGVSHEKYPCNGYTSNIDPHIAFYSASALGEEDEFRARSNEGVGGEKGGSNEYRYFIR